MAALTACPSPRAPGAISVDDRALEVGRAGRTLTGVASRNGALYAAVGAARPQASTTIAAYAAGATGAGRSTGAGGATPVWQAELDGFGGPLAVTGDVVVATIGGSGTVGGIALRGDPGAVLVGLDAARGAKRWQLAVDGTEWVSVATIAGARDGVLIGGSFSGTLRIGDRVVSSAGRTDGFVAKVSAAGAIVWLRRLGGPGSDSVAGIAVSGEQLAIAGTYAAGAEILGEPLAAFDERSLHVDGFVAALDSNGNKRWAVGFGGAADEVVAGVAIDASGRIAVAATVRDTVHVAGTDLVVNGGSDGLVAWWSGDGAAGAAVLLGGPDLDSLRAIAALGDHVVVAGSYAGALRLGTQDLHAAGGDDAFFAELAPTGTVVRAWPISGDGREEVTALASQPGGFIAGVAHSAGARIGNDTLPSPADPMAGAALIVRGAR